jgi:hypothetical protein
MALDDSAVPSEQQLMHGALRSKESERDVNQMSTKQQHLNNI